MTAKKIIIPIGFNAEQCKRGVLAHFADDITTEWMTDQDCVQQYLYCQEELEYTDPNFPFGEFLIRMDEKIAEIIKVNVS